MGGASSQPAADDTVKSLESRLAASGDLSLLRQAFSNLSASSSGDGSSVPAKELQASNCFPLPSQRAQMPPF